MARDFFYYGTTRSYVVAFSTLLDGIKFKDGWGNERIVPYNYSPKEKWVEELFSNKDPSLVNYETTFPRIGFEFPGMTYDSNRNTNALSKLDNVQALDEETSKVYTLNRLAYNYDVKVYIAAVRFNDLLQIVEQFVPFFTPSLTLAVHDTTQLGFSTNITITLNSVSYSNEYEGSFDTRRIVTGECDLTLKGYQYSNPRSAERIQNAVINLTPVQFESQLEAIEHNNYITIGSNTVIVNEGTVTNQDSSNTITGTAIASIPKSTVVAISNGNVYVPDLTNPSDVSNVVGITASSVDAGGTVAILQQCKITDPTWTLVPGVVYCSAHGGSITQDKPTTGAVIRVGVAVDPNTVAINIHQASFTLP